MQLRIVFKLYRAREPYSGRHYKLAATLLCQMLHGLAEGFGIECATIANAAKLCDAYRISRYSGPLNGRHVKRYLPGSEGKRLSEAQKEEKSPPPTPPLGGET